MTSFHYFFMILIDSIILVLYFIFFLLFTIIIYKLAYLSYAINDYIGFLIHIIFNPILILILSIPIFYSIPYFQYYGSDFIIDYNITFDDIINNNTSYHLDIRQLSTDIKIFKIEKLNSFFLKNKQNLLSLNIDNNGLIIQYIENTEL